MATLAKHVTEGSTYVVDFAQRECELRVLA